MDAHHVSVSMGFPRQEYWSGVSFPPPGDLPKYRNRTLISCMGRQVLYHWANREAHAFIYHVIKFNILLRNRVSWVFHIEKSFHLAYTIYTISSSGPFFITSYSRLLHWTESLCATWKVACNPLQKPLPFLGNTLPKRILLLGVMVKKILGNR